jgi:hypothetical protein
LIFSYKLESLVDPNSQNALIVCGYLEVNYLTSSPAHI